MPLQASSHTPSHTCARTPVHPHPPPHGCTCTCTLMHSQEAPLSHTPEHTLTLSHTHSHVPLYFYRSSGTLQTLFQTGLLSIHLWDCSRLGIESCPLPSCHGCIVPHHEVIWGIFPNVLAGRPLSMYIGCLQACAA